MFCGLFTSVLGKNAAEANKTNQSGSGNAAAVMDPPTAPLASAVALPSPPKPASSTATGTTSADASKPEAKACPKCGSTEPWGISSWCPNCFYHPRLGEVVITAPPPDPEVRHLAAGHSQRPEAYAEVLKSVPLWIHMLWVGVVGIFVMSVFMTLKLPKTGYERALWTLAQAGIGLIAAAVAHVLVFFKAIPATDKYGPFDLFVKPLDFWRYALHKMPTGAWRLWLFAWGLTAALSAIVLIGGINYSSIFETKSTKKKSKWYQTSQVLLTERGTLSA
jgi:hypothetical protein